MGSAGHGGPVFMGDCPESSFPSLAPATGVVGHRKAVCRQWMLPVTCYPCLQPRSSDFGSSLQQPVTAAYMCTKQPVRSIGSRLFFSLPPWKITFRQTTSYWEISFCMDVPGGGGDTQNASVENVNIWWCLNEGKKPQTHPFSLDLVAWVCFLTAIMYD